VGLWGDDEFLVTDSINGTLGHSFAVDIPLRLEERLNNIVGFRAATESHGVGVLFTNEAKFLKLFVDCNTSVESHHSSEFFTTNMVDLTCLVEHVDEFKVVAFTAEVIVGVVSGGDLDGTSTVVHVNQHVISNDDNFAVGTEGMLKLLANKVLVAGIFRVDSDSNITKHCLETSSGNSDQLVSSLDSVLEFSQSTELVGLLGVVTRHRQECLTLDVQVLNLKIGERGPQVA